MKTRLLTSLYIVLILILAFISKIWTPYVFDVLIGFLAVMGTVEVARVLERSRRFNSIPLVGTFPAALYIGLVIGFLNEWTWDLYLILLLSIMIFYFILSYVLTFAMKKTTAKERNRYQVTESMQKYATTKALNTIFVIIYPALLFACLFMLNHIDEILINSTVSFQSSIFDIYLLISAFLVTMITDSLAMVVGSFIKGPKLCPRISPKKTISGAIGGLAGGVATAFAVYFLFAINLNFRNAFELVGGTLWTVAIIGLVGSLISQIGDIVASALKRHARVKDYGTIFPGHGGVMDRVDGLIFNAAFVLILAIILV